MSDQPIQNEHEIMQHPTIFITADEFGDVRFSTNSEELDVSAAILMLEIARTKLVAVHLQGVAANKKKHEQRAILTATPRIAKPSGL